MEKRREWAESRRRKSAVAYNQARAVVAMIPMGQPILIGHHSERRHRNAIARSDAAMGRSVESAEMAKHHASKAAGLESQLENSIFSDDPDAIEALQAKVAGLEAERERMKAINKAIRKAFKVPGMSLEQFAAGDFVSPAVSAEELAELVSIRRFSAYGPGYPPYKLSNMGGVISNAKKRVESIKSRQARAAAAEAAGGQLVKIHGEYAEVVFSEKPARSVLDSLKAAGFHWSGGAWFGKVAQLPEGLKAGSNE